MGKAVKADLDLGSHEEAREPMGPGKQVRTILAQDAETETEPTDDGLKLWQEDDSLPPDQRENAPNAERDALVQTISTHVILNTMIQQRYGNTIQTGVVYQELRDPALMNPEITRILAAAGSSPTQINKTNFQRVLSTLEGQYDERQVAELTSRVQSYVNSNTDTVTAQYSQSVQGAVDRTQAAQPNYVQMRPQLSPAPAAGPVASSYNRKRVLAQSPQPPVQEQVASDPLGDPLSSEPFRSVDQLKSSILQFHGEDGRAELYNKVFDLVGPEDEDRAKEALAKFFQGLAGGLFDLYRIFQEKGLASPIDEEMVGQIMQTNPELAPNDGQEQKKAQGLFLPPASSGLYTTSDADGKIEKQASGGVGSTSGCSYTMHGPDEKRMCPKIRNVVNTFICRYHCLDGLVIDDAQVLCGEALWRQAVMDKYSREYKDADGNWVGGYINKRFEVHHDTGGHPYQLKPGQRHAPIHEDAWSTEKRLQEMRRAESKDRDYSETPGDPKGLYNFDQHDIAKGPTPPDLSGKERDKLAKNAAAFNLSTKKAAGEWVGDTGPEIRDLAKQDPTELGDDDGHEAAGRMLDNHKNTGNPLSEDEVRVIVMAGQAREKDFEMRDDGLHWVPPSNVPDGRPSLSQQWYDEDRGINHPAAASGFNLREAKKKGKKEWDPTPWAICHTTVDKDKNPDKYEKCVMEVKEKQASKSFNLSKVATHGGDPMMDNVDHGPRQKQCKKCRKFVGMDAKVCDGMIADPMGGQASPCGGANFDVMYESDVQSTTHGIASPDLPLKASQDVKITCNSGVFRAEADGKWAYGASPKDAARKLSVAIGMTKLAAIEDGLNRVDTPPMQEMSEEILNKMRQDQGAAPAAPQTGPAAPAGEAEQWATPEGLPPVGELPELGIDGEYDEYEDEYDEGDDVSANDLDVYLEDEAENSDPEEQKETEVQADALGLGPDPRTK
jgi:ketosteroid isomerase-like protein